MIRIMIADNCINNSNEYSKYLARLNNIQIISITNNIHITLQKYFEFKPDILIVNFVLKKDAIQLIEQLSMSTEERKKCNIILISKSIKIDKLSSKYLSKIYRILPEPNYNELLYTIDEIKLPTTIKELSDREIKNLLLYLKVNIYSKGTVYLIDAIQLVYNDPNLLYNITNLYIQVAVKYNVDNYCKIQRSIRGTIDTMNNHITSDILEFFFHIYKNDIVSPKYFFTIVNEYFLENE